MESEFLIRIGAKEVMSIFTALIGATWYFSSRLSRIETIVEELKSRLERLRA